MASLRRLVAEEPIAEPTDDAEERDGFNNDSSTAQANAVSLLLHGDHVFIRLPSGGALTFTSFERAQEYYQAVQGFEADLIVNCAGGDPAAEDDGGPAAAENQAAAAVAATSVRPVIAVSLTESALVEEVKAAACTVLPPMLDVLARGGTVVVHCLEGQVRSPTMVLLFLMYSENMSFKDAHKWLKSISKSCQPMPCAFARSATKIVQSVAAEFPPDAVRSAAAAAAAATTTEAQS